MNRTETRDAPHAGVRIATAPARGRRGVTPFTRTRPPVRRRATRRSQNTDRTMPPGWNTRRVRSRTLSPLSRRAVVAVLSLLPLLTLPGCRRQQGPKTPSSATTDTGAPKEEPPPKPLFAGWGTPALTIAVTGETHGYIEPCGCALNQAGGLGRRHDLIRQIRARGWPVIAADLGGLIRRARQQSRVKFQIMLEGLTEMGYAALQLGPEELHLGPAELLSCQANLLNSAVQAEPHDAGRNAAPAGSKQAESASVPSETGTAPADPGADEPLRFLGANIAFFGTPELPEGPRRWLLLKRGGYKVAVVGVFGRSLVESTFPGGTGDDVTILVPEEVLPTVLQEVASRKPDLRVLLSHATLAESRRLARRFPEFDVVFSTGGVEDPLADNPVRVGDTLLCTVGKKGKYVGVVGFFPGQQRTLRFELVELDQTRFTETDAMRRLMARYQQLLKELDLVRSEPPIPHPSGGRFVGAEACGRCHTRAYQKWKTSRHAHAYESLKVGRKGQEKKWIPRTHDPECLCCHVTGWEPQQVLRYESGFLSIEDTPNLAGQQCENCHGPGGGPGRHVELEARWLVDPSAVSRDDLIAGRRQMKLTVEQAEKNVCIRCHDLDNSPRFQFAKYWEEIKHPWRD
ncbi:MAG: hypothetical protein D6725_03755 [Planctomycetota bacterium]|nr:MAG: hypothetical protein D6725_03755 [Planctomycetota bacterium]